MFQLSKIMSSAPSSVHQAPFQGSAAVTSQLPSSWTGWGVSVGAGEAAGASVGAGEAVAVTVAVLSPDWGAPGASWAEPFRVRAKTTPATRATARMASSAGRGIFRAGVGEVPSPAALPHPGQN